eukprot:Blabericola_migrator_1__8248@NODE_4276_length_1243_cov_282_468537_g2571_i2_p1_GENE_NODE_4276_length_1243_cov_282_468537_g2571_i2NODE_4276_length_1243_cov_282_468537_g2571_i2_p1_ORF_typecomplete_len117_score5_23_NODE_4276_length_1243_cov_282_468537_g2571_i27641114
MCPSQKALVFVPDTESYQRSGHRNLWLRDKLREVIGPHPCGCPGLLRVEQGLSAALYSTVRSSVDSNRAAHSHLDDKIIPEWTCQSQLVIVHASAQANNLHVILILPSFPIKFLTP